MNESSKVEEPVAKEIMDLFDPEDTYLLLTDGAVDGAENAPGLRLVGGLHQ